MTSSSPLTLKNNKAKKYPNESELSFSVTVHKNFKCLSLISLQPLDFDRSYIEVSLHSFMVATDEDRPFMMPFTSHKSADSLAIPLAFNKYFPEPLPNTVDLLDYCGRSWTIRMKKRGETVFLTVGWENFVKDKELEDGKMMNFIYDCNRTFHVIIFGHGSVSEFRAFPQAVVDVSDYATGTEEEDDE